MTRTSVANDPKAANEAIWRSPITLKVSANSAGITSVARTARRTAGVDHTGRQGVDAHPVAGRIPIARALACITEQSRPIGRGRPRPAADRCIGSAYRRPAAVSGLVR
ncbi:MAG: hypothetical protein ACLP0J_13750 [Solirubrobacteraceae bacterium]